MKKLFILFCVGLLSQSLLANPMGEKIGEVKGKITITRTWVEKNPDGSFKYMLDIPCKQDVKIPVYRMEKPPEASREAMEVKLPDMSEINIAEMTIGSCKTSYRTGEPIELSIISSLAYIYDSKANRVSSKVFSAASYYSVTPKKNHQGNFSTFSTEDANLKHGSLVLTGNNSNVDDLLKESFFGAVVEFQE